MNNIKILIADDDILISTMLSKLLCAIGFESNNISLAYCGNDAIKCFEDSDIDLIFMDIVMPDINGYETTEHIRDVEETEGRKKSIIMAITAYAEMNTREKCLLAGCDDYIPKPVNMEKLKEALEKHGIL